MKKYIVVNLYDNFIYITFFTVYICIGGIEISWWINLATAVIPSFLTGIITLHTSRKSQMNTNTNTLKKLCNRLGISHEKTLTQTINDKFDSISADIGRNDNSSLTRQHMDMEKNILQSFKIIEKRYENEDATYRNFTQNQYDLKKTLDNFSKDYYEHIKNENQLKVQISELTAENQKLHEQIKTLQKQINKSKSKNNDDISL